MPIISDTRLTELAGRTKPPAVAGLFYPDDAVELRAMIQRMIAAAPAGQLVPKALIAPHAGYVYSGPVAASAYASLIPAAARIKRVVLLGPAHRVYLRGLALSRADRFATPIGSIPVDKDLRERIATLEHVHYNDAAFAQEHSLEVHLPFLQSVLDDFMLLPIVVGDADADQVADLLQRVWGGDETLIVISSDLSHYHDYATAGARDRQTTEHIRTLQFTRIGPEDACGCRPIAGLLKFARERGYEVRVIDVRNSGDTAGGRDRVVGYGAYAIHPANAQDKALQTLLSGIAAGSIEHGFEHGTPLRPDPASLPEPLRKPAAVFVTLTIDKRLRGCIGTTEPVSPLATAVAINAFNAAFRDPRFPPLTVQEYPHTGIGISILSEKTPVRFLDEQDLIRQLQPGITGLVIARDQRRATFLPSVWGTLPEPSRFLAELKHKAGMAGNEAPEQAWFYTSTSFSMGPNGQAVG